MHDLDGMQYDPIQGQGQDYHTFKVGNPSISQTLIPLPFTTRAGN